MNILYLELPQ